MAQKKPVKIRGKKYYKKQITCPNGKRKTLYAKTLSELREKENEFRSALKKTCDNGGTTVAAYAMQQLEYMKPRVQHSTYVGYEEKVRHYIAVSPLGDKLLAEVTADDIQGALVRVVPLSESTYRTVHMLLRRIFGAAKKAT